MMNRLAIMVMFCISQAQAANVFTGDAACEDVWRLESGALTTDGSGNGNTLTNDGVDASGTYMEGSYSGDFELADTDWLLIDDSDLSAGFPLKTGDSTCNISVCFWFRIESYTASAYMFSKFDLSINDASFGVLHTNVPKIGFIIGYNAGSNYESVWGATSLSSGVWYHVGVTYEGSTKAYKIRVYNATTASIVENLSGTTTNSIAVTAASVMLGARDEGATAHYDGLMDEVVVFSDILTTGEIDLIRAGTYGASSGSERRRIIISAGGG